jgi:putative membrane protein
VTLDGRALRLLALAAWAAFLLWLWASDEVLRYLGPRTEWIVPVGGIALSIATVVYAQATHSSPNPTRPTATEIVGTVALLAPIIVAAVLSGSSLGSLAASKKLTARGVDLAALARLESGSTRELTFIDLQAGVRDPDIADAKDIHPGRAVTLTGFVSGTPSAADRTFTLMRFYITCCVADSIPIGITIQTPTNSTPPVKRDDWVTVTGAVYNTGKAYGIRALRIKHIPQPKHPYLAFTA